jgi:VanZ family protein
MLARYTKYEKVFYIFCSLAWMALIYFLSSLPGNSLGPDHGMLNCIKKLGHFGLYGILAFLYLYAMRGRGATPRTGIAVYATSLFFAVLYAVSDEYHQSFVPGRHAAVTDVMIDAFGAITMLGIVYVRHAKDQPQCERIM